MDGRLCELARVKQLAAVVGFDGRNGRIELSRSAV